MINSGITATTILRSRNSYAPNKVLSTLLLRYPRCIHAEVMTHRVFSRNSASSRAIPVAKLIKDVKENPFIPMVWGKNQKGMQSNEECDDQVEVGSGLVLSNEKAWLFARDNAIRAAEAFSAAGYHKQIVNRLIEPFAYITVLVSATEWDNFLELRDHPDAEPHIQILAKAVRKCLEDESTIQTLQPGQWHLPFADDRTMLIDDRIKLSVARCASTSYKTVDGFEMTLERAVELAEKLAKANPGHYSPFEHIACADDISRLNHDIWIIPEQHGNFIGFRQYRHMLEE